MGGRLGCRGAVAVVGLVACGQHTVTESLELPADGVLEVAMTTERGDLAYSGNGASETFTLDAVRWGRAASDGRATTRVEGTDFGAWLEAPRLEVWGTAGGGRAGVDLLLDGPRFVDVDAWAPEGTVALYEVDGFHYVTAWRVVGEGVHGDLDAYAEFGGIDVEVWPRSGSVIRLETVNSDLWVALPAGLAYDLDLAGDPGYGYDLVDLGFDELVLGPGYAMASAGEGTVKVQLLATGGTIHVVPALPPVTP